MSRYALQSVVLSLVLSVSIVAQERSVWKIGVFDSSSAEFSSDTATSESIYIVSKSQAKDWFLTQQALLPSKAVETAQRRIQFELHGAPQGTYKLKLGLIVIKPRLPVVQVNVNGHTGWFYQHPETDYREGNIEGSIFPQYSIGTFNIELPAEFFRQGSNEISLTAVADPLSTALPGGEITDDAVLTYDALALDNVIGAQTAPGITGAQITPTVFYKREGKGLAEIVSVLVRWNRLAPRGSITLSLPGYRRTQTLASNHEFGEQRFEFTVPEFIANTRASITVTANNRNYNFAQILHPAKKWTIYLVPHEHLDVGYSDFQTKLSELHSRVIDDAMQMSDKHTEFKFSLDGYWQAQQFLEGRSEAEKQKLYAAIRDKKIFVPAQHSVMLTGFPLAETLLRSFYGAHKLNRASGGDWNYANATDVPSYSWSYASIMAAAGLKYFSAAANADRGPTLMLGDLHRHSPFWWEGPDGARVLMWYARHYHQIGSEFGFPPVVATGYEGLPSFLRVYERPDYQVRRKAP